MTRQQKKLLDFIASEIRGHGVCPSFEAMMVHMGLKSKSGVHRLVCSLEEHGKIKRLKNRARAIELVTAKMEPTIARAIADELAAIRRASLPLDEAGYLAVVRATMKIEQLVMGDLP